TRAGVGGAVVPAALLLPQLVQAGELGDLEAGLEHQGAAGGPVAAVLVAGVGDRAGVLHRAAAGGVVGLLLLGRLLLLGLLRNDLLLQRVRLARRGLGLGGSLRGGLVLGFPLVSASRRVLAVPLLEELHV